jgi:membrane protein
MSSAAIPAGGHAAHGTWRVLYDAARAWARDNAIRLSAATAMYTILSLSPLLVITIKATALILGDEAASGQVRRQVQQTIGPVGAGAVEGMIANTVRPGSGLFATVVSFGLLIFTASGVFAEIRDSLNSIWEITPPPSGGVWRTVRGRFLSIGMVFVIGFLFLVSQVLTTLLTVLSEYVLGGPGWVAVAIDLVVSTLVITVLFALIYSTLSDARPDWQDVLLASVVTAVLFKIGQYLQALYFTYGSTASLYGAAGSFVVVMLWVYYSCWILFYGAELIHARAKSLGRSIRPAPGGKSGGDRPTVPPIQ